ncbi:MAG: RepB family plasmid replication initiator protein [Syntrophales bacterium]
MNKGLEDVGDILRRSFRNWQVHQPSNESKIRYWRSSQRNISFLPTIMTRLSPFFPVSKSQMKTDTITEPIIIENPWGKITIRNRKLSIYDETVLLSLLILLKKYNSSTFQTTLYELCRLMNVKPSRNTYNAIIKSLHRMAEAHITMDKKALRDNASQTVIDGPTITGITKNEESRKMILELNSYLLSSFRDRSITRMDIRLRSELRGEISKALYRFYEGQHLNICTTNILKLSRAINISCDEKMFCLRRKIRKAMHELEVGGYLRRFMLPDRGKVVAVFKSRNRFLNNYI